MSNLKSHLTSPDGVACGRVVRNQTNDSRRVTCQACRSTPAFTDLKSVQDAAAEVAFQAQTPRTVSSLFGQQIVCRCGNDTFRERPRSLHSYHYVCSECGQSSYPLTETGMCS